MYSLTTENQTYGTSLWGLFSIVQFLAGGHDPDVIVEYEGTETGTVQIASGPASTIAAQLYSILVQDLTGEPDDPRTASYQ